jgi:hypothetical protein
LNIVTRLLTASIGQSFFLYPTKLELHQKGRSEKERKISEENAFRSLRWLFKEREEGRQHASSTFRQASR